MAGKVVSQEVLNELVDKIQEIVNNYCWNLEYFTDEECEKFFDGTQEEIDYYSSLIKDDVVSKNFLHSSKQISEDIAKGILEANDYTNDVIKNISSIKLKYVTNLPSVDISESTIYILKSTDSSVKDTLNLYNAVNGWTEIGSFDININDYVDKTTYESDMLLKANKNEMISNDKIVQTLDSTTNSSNTILSTNGLQAELNTKENKSNKVTIIDNSSTNDQYPSAKSVYDSCIKNNNLKTYTDVTQLGLTSTTSISDIFNAMDNNSLGIFECNGIVSDTPSEYGTLIIEKKNNARFNLLFKLSSQDEVLDNSMYVGNLKGADGTGIVWNKIISSNMIATSLSSDVTNEQVLSAKCVYDNYLSTGKILEENCDWNTLTTGTYKIIGDRISTFTNSLFDTFPNEYPYGDLIVSKSGLIWHMMYIPNGSGLKDDNTSYETNVVVMAGRDTGESGIWFKLASYNDLKKRVEDTSWVTKIASSNFSKGNVYYRKKDGICHVYVEDLTIGSSGVNAGTVICSGLPTPELSMWSSIVRNDGDKSILVKPNMNGDLVTYTGTEGSYYDHFTYIVKE